MAIESSSVSAREQVDQQARRPSRRRLGRLAAWCRDRQRRVLVGWLLAAAAVIGLAQAVGPGPPPVVARAGPVFTAFLVPHIVAGLTALSSGAAILVSRKGTGWHARAGTTYFWAISLLVLTAAGLTAVRGTRDLPVFALGLLALALAAAGRHARRHPGARPWRAWPGHGPHILGMTSSYTVMWTAFLADNARFLPAISRLPTAFAMLLPSVVAAPLVVWSLRRHRGPKRPPARETRAVCADGVAEELPVVSADYRTADVSRPITARLAPPPPR
jgi:hypothetical protein